MNIKKEQPKPVLDVDFLPARNLNPDETMKAEKNFRTGLSRSNYLVLEVEAMERDLTAYKLSQTVLTLYLNKQLIYPKTLPQSIQDQITEHFKNSESLDLSLGGTEPV